MTRFRRISFHLPHAVNNDNGMVMITAILILVLLTIIGFAASKVSNTEVRIAGHEVSYLQNFYRAEGATMEAVQQLEGIADLSTAGETWLDTSGDVVTTAKVEDNGFWQSGSGSLIPESSSVLDDTQYVAVSQGPVEGTSLKLTGSKVYAYTIYGHCAPEKRGTAVVEIGYLIAY